MGSILLRTFYNVLTAGNGPFLRIFMREVTSGHEIESEIGHSIDLGLFLHSYLGHGGSGDQKRSLDVQNWQSNLAFDLMTRCDSAHQEWPQVHNVPNLAFDFVTRCDLSH